VIGPLLAYFCHAWQWQKYRRQQCGDKTCCRHSFAASPPKAGDQGDKTGRQLVVKTTESALTTSLVATAESIRLVL